MAAGLLVALLVFAEVPSDALAQWRYRCSAYTRINAIYFLDLPGPPRIGFAGMSAHAGTMDSFQLLKTTNGGVSWRAILSSQSVSDIGSDFCFKDSLTGWLAVGFNGGGGYKTSDGGDTWISMPGVTDGMGVYYDSTSHGLFFSGFGGRDFVSWDEGATVSPIWPAKSLGYSFASPGNGVVVQGYDYPNIPHRWLRTSDGGHTWAEVAMDSECWQPLGIQGSKTYFAITDFSGTVCRTDDAWDTWREIYRFPVDASSDGFSTGCIRGDLTHLFVQLSRGCYMSTDTGHSWRYLCGMPSTMAVSDNRFYVKGSYVYIGTYNNLAIGPAQLWSLNVDSMQYFRTDISFASSSKQISIKAGSTVSLDITADQSQLGIDSGHIVIRFDPALGFRSVKLPPSWVITDSSTRGGVLDLTIKGDSNTELPNPILQLTFNTYLTAPSARIYLDYAHLFGKRLNCDCQALSTDGTDSVEIDFDGCGDSTLLHFMSTGSPFQIESVEPNPAGSEVRVHFASAPSVPVEVGVLDVLGKLRFSREVSGQSAALEVSSLPDGVYYLRVSSGGFVETRRVVVGR